MSDQPSPQTSDEWLTFTEMVERWADEMRADLDENGTRTKYDWIAWDLLRSAGGHLRGVAAQIAAREEIDT